MATYGMKDAANLTLVDKKTKKVALFIDYANATSSEWSAERVYATKKGTNAIAWDSNRQGTLTIDSEIFDLSYLALAIGSDIAKGRTDIMKRKAITLDASKQVTLQGSIEPESVSIIKLKDDMIEHDGSPIYSTTGHNELLPDLVENIAIAVKDTEAKIVFSAVPDATTYEIYRDEERVDVITRTDFIDTGLTPVTAYTYTVRGVNEYGTGSVSAEVKVTTATEGTKEFGVAVTATAEAIEEARTNAIEDKGEANEVSLNMVTYSVEGNVVTFNDKALVGENYAIYYLEEVDNVRTITVSADKFPSSYEIFADALIREQETGSDEFVQFHYKNARPQSNFTLTQSATEPTSLSVVFDLFPDKDKNLAEFKVID